MEKIKELAKENGRSVNKEIEFALNFYVKSLKD
ncbi:Arc family DNA-binding protein [Listeria monocytogenes]|nr:Arc family DNA-binding protein [Listeria monocytogenes]